jgi:hypothetical protein
MRFGTPSSDRSCSFGPGNYAFTKILRSFNSPVYENNAGLHQTGNANMRNTLSCCLLVICTSFFAKSNYAQFPRFNNAMRTVKQIPVACRL